ncbi:MAG: hypothetical protein KAU10_09490, partial [Dehalococcoidia bacterium]|nr:hypothetical protein [Dehalococcoidia bacterium]
MMKKNKRKRNGLKGIVLFIFWMGFSIIFTSVLLAQDPYLADVVVTPENPTMQVGQSLEFTASGKDQNGDPFPISDPQWEGSSHGTLSVNPTDPAKCTFTTTKTGAGYIICWEGPPRRGPHGSTDITITQGSGQVLGSIVVSPTNVNLEFGEQQQFTALGYDQNDEPMDPPITPIWSTDGGTVTQSGQYTAPSSAGDYTVTAGTSGSSITGTANVHVTAPSQVLGSVVVSPASVDLEYGEQQQFSATGYDQNGNPTDPPITPIWSTDGGTVTQSGDYTAPDTTGDYTVTGGVSGSTITGTANVHVTAPSQVLGSVVVSPANVNLEVGGQQQFSATGYD